MMICVEDNFAGEKVFEFFQDTDDFRLRQFGRRKSLWIFPRYWWFWAKTLLQAKNSLNKFRIMMICVEDNFAGEKFLNNFRIMMICVEDNFAGEKVFEFFQDTDDFRLRQFGRRKSLWIFPRYWWFWAKTLLQAKNSLNKFRIMMICV